MYGRADDLINVGGEKVSPLEVEAVAVRVPGLVECGCVGVPDPADVLGEVPVLFYVAEDGLGERELRATMAAGLATGKLPRAYVRLEELPRNSRQKLDRRALRRLWEARTRG